MSIHNFEQENITERLTEFIDGDLTPEEMAEMQHWISTNEDIRVLYHQLREILLTFEAINHSTPIPVPSEKMESRYDQWLDQVKVKQKTAVIPLRFWYKIAAAVLIVIVAGIAGMTFRTMYNQKQELSSVKYELEQTKQLVMAQLGNTQSASQRISAVYSTEDIVSPDQDIIQLLIRTMDEDPSSNVRMASLEALSKYYHLPEVRTAMILSMKFQKDPVVQIALIQLLVQRKEKIIIDDLQKITVQNGIIKAVKDEAYQGIFKLT